jgi:beta-phosphoglucomutase-like phosphatase (HAD superfamily)
VAPRACTLAPTLLLFDVDGTLVAGAAQAHALALRAALHDVHGIDPEPGRSKVSPAGRTDGEIARMLLLEAEVSAAQIDERADDVRAACCEHYARLCPPDLSDKVIDGIPALLSQLQERTDVTLSLVTGNYEPVGRLKLARRARPLLRRRSGRLWLRRRGPRAAPEDRAATRRLRRDRVPARADDRDR